MRRRQFWSMQKQGQLGKIWGHSRAGWIMLPDMIGIGRMWRPDDLRECPECGGNWVKIVGIDYDRSGNFITLSCSHCKRQVIGMMFLSRPHQLWI